MLATVKGDVHDIGKNLVDIILTNNGYTVYNLGIKQPIEDILDAAGEAEGRRHRHERPAGEVHGRDEGKPRGAEPRRGLQLPVHAGRGGINRRYVEEDLREHVQGQRLLLQDAFDGLHVMDASCRRRHRPNAGEARMAGLKGTPASASGGRQPPDSETYGGEQEGGLGDVDDPSRCAPGERRRSSPPPARIGHCQRAEHPRAALLGQQGGRRPVGWTRSTSSSTRSTSSQQWGFGKGGQEPRRVPRNRGKTVRPIFARTSRARSDKGVLRAQAGLRLLAVQQRRRRRHRLRPGDGKEQIRFTFPRQPTGGTCASPTTSADVVGRA